MTYETIVVERRGHSACIRLNRPEVLNAINDQMIDLSAGGAKLNCSCRLSSGTALALDCGTFERSGIVRWQDGAFLGLSFDNELDDREMAALVDRSAALSAWMGRRD